MLELTPVRKNKVNLADYNCQQDIGNRMLLADFSTFDLEVLEEILFSPLKISFKKLVRQMDCSENDLSAILEKLKGAGLLSIQEDFIIVDKDMRKYFEFQIVRFDPSFKPDMEFLSGLLKKVPIHFLPAWYAIPRTSNNIFESIVEKYLLTPQIFLRYLADLHFADLAITGIISDLFKAPDSKLYSSDCIVKYNLTRRHFEEILLLLEFNFIGCLSYEKADDHWIEIITPFYEWHQYLRFLRDTDPPRIARKTPIVKTRESDFAFIEDMSAILEHCMKKPIAIGSWHAGTPLSAKVASELSSHCGIKGASKTYLTQVLQKLLLVQLIQQKGQKIEAMDAASDFLAMSLENRAQNFYRNQKNQILNFSIPPQVATERNIRESEKSIKRVLHGDWVFLDDFLKSVLVVLSEDSVIVLKRTGKHWKYNLPSYSSNEMTLLKAVIFEWLFETGMVATGTYLGRECFAATPFGRFFFEE